MTYKLPYNQMKIQIFKLIRDSLLSTQSLQKRRDSLASIKTSQAAFSALGLASFVLAVINAHEGKWFPAFGLLSLSYVCLEGKTVADNFREILEHPSKELHAACAKLHSDEKLWKMVTEGALVTRKIGLWYLNPKPNKTKSNLRLLFSQIFGVRKNFCLSGGKSSKNSDVRGNCKTSGARKIDDFQPVCLGRRPFTLWPSTTLSKVGLRPQGGKMA